MLSQLKENLKTSPKEIDLKFLVFPITIMKKKIELDKKKNKKQNPLNFPMTIYDSFFSEITLLGTDSISTAENSPVCQY